MNKSDTGAVVFSPGSSGREQALGHGWMSRGYAPVLLVALLLSMAAEVAVGASLVGGRYAAFSTTALAFTGDIALTDRRLVAEQGQVYDTRILKRVPASMRYGTAGGTFADLMQLPPSASVEIRQVLSESVPPHTRNGGLCGRTRDTAVLVLARLRGKDPRGVSIAAFRLTGADGQRHASLCGTFGYFGRPASSRRPTDGSLHRVAAPGTDAAALRPGRAR